MVRWEMLLVKLAFVLLILAALGPLMGQATLAQTLVLAVVVAAGLFVLDQFLLPGVLPFAGNPMAAAGEGLFAAVAIRYLTPLLGATYDWAGSLALGVVIGVSEFFLHRWADVRNLEGTPGT